MSGQPKLPLLIQNVLIATLSYGVGTWFPDQIRVAFDHSLQFKWNIAADVLIISITSLTMNLLGWTQLCVEESYASLGFNPTCPRKPLRSAKSGSIGAIAGKLIRRVSSLLAAYSCMSGIA